MFSRHVGDVKLRVQIIPWLSYSVPGVLNMGFLTIDTGIALYCFLLCVVVDPGRCIRHPSWVGTCKVASLGNTRVVTPAGGPPCQNSLSSSLAYGHYSDLLA